MTNFSLRKKAVGVYFNDRDTICSVQVSREHEATPAAKLITAIQGSRDVFFALYGSYRLPSELAARLQSVVSDLAALRSVGVELPQAGEKAGEKTE